MTDERMPGTRERILMVALELFGAHGYHRTTVRAIADRLDISKAGVLYHFPSKDDILAGLAEPLLAAMAAAVAEAAHPDPRTARRRVLEGLLDVFLEHRYLLRLTVNDLALAAPGAIFERFRATMLAAHRLVAGPSPALADRVRAAQALGALSDPVVVFAAESPGDLRAEVLAGVELLYPADAGRVVATRGRPAALDAERIATARRMSGVEQRSATEIAAALGVSRATVYRYLQ
ncbi:TetR family transcriptional regulator [Nocardia canadensis]|uniref:TetR family transcriptional regulator n=1 Tax=Nocardia canadensis TaxID=3065238 RepID=UPI00292F6627|nr:TetR family transcriptional regulator [Nocardia canadensis]